MTVKAITKAVKDQICLFLLLPILHFLTLHLQRVSFMVVLQILLLFMNR